MRVLASERSRDEAFARQHGIALCTQEELLRESDFVSLHVRLSDQTREMIGAAQLDLMKPTAILINTARRELIAEDALVRALQEKRIAGDGLDVPPGPWSQPLRALHNGVVTPHLGNRASVGVNSVLRTAVQNCLAVFAGRRPPFVVNPSVYQEGPARAAAASHPAPPAPPDAPVLQQDRFR
jgi:phosphoglycerate dehydrogenase-like enzyme